jgi:hypothetical protein
MYKKGELKKCFVFFDFPYLFWFSNRDIIPKMDISYHSLVYWINLTEKI